MNGKLYKKSLTPFWQPSCEEEKMITKDSLAHNRTDLEPREGKHFVTKKTLTIAEKEKKCHLNHLLDNFISFPVIYRFRGIRCIVREFRIDK